MKMNRVGSFDNRAKPPASQYMNLRLHSDYVSDVTKVKDFGNASPFVGSLIDIGASVGVYSNGFFSPDGTQSNKFTDQALLDLFNPLPLVGVGGMLFMMTAKATANPASGFNTIFCGGSQSTGNGYSGFSVTHQANGNYNFRSRANEAPIVVGSTVNPGDTAAHTICYYADYVPATPTVVGYLDGTIATPSNLTVPVLGVSPDRGFSLFCDQSTNVVTDHLTNSNGEDLAVADIWFVKFDYDASGIVQDIISEYTATPREPNLMSLAGR